MHEHEARMTTSAAHNYSAYTLRDFTAAIFRQYRVGLACFLFVTSAVTAAVIMAPKVYDADLKILVKRDRADTLVSGRQDADGASGGDVTEPEVLSEVELLQARDLLERVAIESGLAKQAAAVPGDKSDPVARAVSALDSRLNVIPVRRTWMINVTYTSRNPQQAKTVLDTLTRLYLEKHLAVHRPVGAHKFFADQSDQSAVELKASQTLLEEFGERNHIVSAKAQQEAALQKVAEFEGLQRQTEVALAEATRRIEGLELEKANTPARRTAEVHTSDPAVVQEIQTRILTLETKRTELLQKFTPEYRLVTEVDQLLAQARTALEEARRNPVTDRRVGDNPTMQWLENELARARPERAALQMRVSALREAVASYRAKAESLTKQEMEQRDLERGVKTAEEKVTLYKRKEEEARISDALDRNRIANVVIAQAPSVPSEPRRTRSLVWLPIGVLAAFVLAIGAALAMDAFSVSIRTPDELQTALDLPVTTWVPADPH
jgi:uncharacterized protein involved in exopolysaccharide biosynthesis